MTHIFGCHILLGLQKRLPLCLCLTMSCQVFQQIYILSALFLRDGQLQLVHGIKQMYHTINCQLQRYGIFWQFLLSLFGLAYVNQTSHYMLCLEVFNNTVYFLKCSSRCSTQVRLCPDSLAAAGRLILSLISALSRSSSTQQQNVINRGAVLSAAVHNDKSCRRCGFSRLSRAAYTVTYSSKISLISSITCPTNKNHVKIIVQCCKQPMQKFV